MAFYIGFASDVVKRSFFNRSVSASNMRAMCCEIRCTLNLIFKGLINDLPQQEPRLIQMPYLLWTDSKYVHVGYCRPAAGGVFSLSVCIEIAHYTCNNRCRFPDTRQSNKILDSCYAGCGRQALWGTTNTIRFSQNNCKSSVFCYPVSGFHTTNMARVRPVYWSV